MGLCSCTLLKLSAMLAEKTVSLVHPYFFVKCFAVTSQFISSE